MAERTGLVKMGDNALTLMGDDINVGDKAPDFTALNTDLAPVKLSEYQGKVIVLAAVPSLDTPVCDLETRRFNSEMASLSEDIIILTISMDLPFAQKRWCGAQGVERVTTLSDHKDADFGMKYGVLIKELRLLARAIFVLDRQGVVQYKEIVPELGSEPNYDNTLQKANDLL
jgi:thiol peroxidase